MAKFTSEEKIQAVKRYLNGNESVKNNCEIDWCIIIVILQMWIKQYEHHGVEAFDKTLYKLHSTV